MTQPASAQPSPGGDQSPGEVMLSGAAQELRVGDKIELIPRHGCTTVNLYDRYHVMKDGALVDVWDVAARGRCQ